MPHCAAAAEAGASNTQRGKEDGKRGKGGRDIMDGKAHALRKAFLQTV
jgi:hypothetical protein